MTNTERSTYPSSSKPYGSSVGAAADAQKDDLASKGADSVPRCQGRRREHDFRCRRLCWKEGSRKPWTTCAESADTLAVAIEEISHDATLHDACAGCGGGILVWSNLASLGTGPDRFRTLK